jgi:Ni,Fe-hydrogenase I large subunit
VLPARADWLRLMGYLAGKWPHSLALQPGGTTRAITATEKVRLLTVLREFRAFLSSRVFGDTLENVGALRSAGQLTAWAQGRAGDFPRFLEIAADLGLERIGRGSDTFLSYGAYAQPRGEGSQDDHREHLFARGVWRDGVLAFDEALISEDVAHAWLFGEQPLHPRRARRARWSPSLPTSRRLYLVQGAALRRARRRNRCAGPADGRWPAAAARAGRRQRRQRPGASRRPAIRNRPRRTGDGRLGTRADARRAVLHQWQLPDQATAVGLVEAARGALGHWLHIEGGKIARYQIIAPTTWNFSPRDAGGVPGALEQALVGLPVGEGESVPLAVQHVVRSFDPCMVCTVH